MDIVYGSYLNIDNLFTKGPTIESDFDTLELKEEYEHVLQPHDQTIIAEFMFRPKIKRWLSNCLEKYNLYRTPPDRESDLFGTPVQEISCPREAKRLNFEKPEDTQIFDALDLEEPDFFLAEYPYRV